MKIRFVKQCIMALFLLFIFLTPGHGMQQFLVVRIINPHPFPVMLYSQVLNSFGYQNWVPVTQINPQSYVDIPNVPIGSVLGVDCKPINRSWPPFSVYQVSAYMPNFIYQVPP
ncbi:MAG: hypothetical protein A2464_07100 [Deltaproteobacteria bacterium RIFOXYC2_FULL_48_10]|nr:MAG: hypothetical protein A2464_07100 [Deltaproteobacteria bacterium RIFOXYC2_FULL_48_10]